MSSDVVKWSAGGIVHVVVKAVVRNKSVAERYKKLVKDGKAVVEGVYFNKHGVKLAHQYALKDEEDGV